jgi:hypothetical protein
MPKSKPKQERIPGTENKLQDLHDAAIEYAQIRDERMACGVQEKDKKSELLNLLKKHKLEHYEYEDVEITLVHEAEKVKVRVHGKEEDEESAA